jgi:lipopolysaccharide transport system ATP-binding protein
MNQPIIRIKNLSKRYKITHQQGGYVALRDVITNIAKRPFRFAKDKAKIIIGKGKKEEFWALKNINLDIQKGEIIGVIGRNGAGKSTLLKILSEITAPTEGEIEINGTVASLLEVGTGFHPELTGRENIFLNGAILGMSKEEIIKKFDQIVEFSGVQKFLDTPVKRYSTGMSVRLAFSVTAHLDPDILLVDEVLAVGDAEFQKKCMGKMDEVTKTAGRTILFVSHNMEAIARLCTRCILLENGEITKVGPTTEVLQTYLDSSPLVQNEHYMKSRRDRKGDGNVKITTVHIENEKNEIINEIIPGGYYSFYLGYEAKNGFDIKNMNIAIDLFDDSAKSITFLNSGQVNQDPKNPPNKGMIKCKIKDPFPLSDGVYRVAVGLIANNQVQDYFNNLLTFKVSPGDFYHSGVMPTRGKIYLNHEWIAIEK